MLTFLVGSRQAFEVSLADVSQTQLQGKNDVILEFHVDDTTGANEVRLLILRFELRSCLIFILLRRCVLKLQKDSVMEITFHVPNTNTQFVGDENRPPAQVSLFLICGEHMKFNDLHCY